MRTLRSACPPPTRTALPHHRGHDEGVDIIIREHHHHLTLLDSLSKLKSSLLIIGKLSPLSFNKLTRFINCQPKRKRNRIPIEHNLQIEGMPPRAEQYHEMCQESTSSSPRRINKQHTNGNNMTSNQHPATAPSPPSSALRRMTPFILSGYLFNTILYFTTYALLPPTLIPNAIYCPNNNRTTNCDRRDLFAFQIVSLLNLSFLGLLGFYTFYISRHASKMLPHTTVGRFFGNYNSSVGGGGQQAVVLLPEADYINSVIVIFQGWDFVASLFFEEHCTMIMMSHHTLAFICGYFCLVYEVSDLCELKT